MKPDKNLCAICDLGNVSGCSFRYGSECHPGRAEVPLAQQRADEIHRQVADLGYIKLEPGQRIVDSSSSENYDDVHEMLNDIEKAGLQVLAQTSDEMLSDMTPRFAYECGIKGIIGVIRDQIQKAIKEARNDH